MPPNFIGLPFSFVCEAYSTRLPKRRKRAPLPENLTIVPHEAIHPEIMGAPILRELCVFRDIGRSAGCWGFECYGILMPVRPQSSNMDRTFVIPNRSLIALL